MLKKKEDNRIDPEQIFSLYCFSATQRSIQKGTAWKKLCAKAAAKKKLRPKELRPKQANKTSKVTTQGPGPAFFGGHKNTEKKRRQSGGMHPGN